MRRLGGLGLSIFFVFGSVACGGAQRPALSEDQAMKEVEQLMVLHQEARAKFVVQKEQLIKAEDCTRATMLREAIDKKAAEAAMSPENTKHITLVQMELKEAEKNCLEK